MNRFMEVELDAEVLDAFDVWCIQNKQSRNETMESILRDYINGGNKHETDQK